jgi:hypothetical protein
LLEVPPQTPEGLLVNVDVETPGRRLHFNMASTELEMESCGELRGALPESWLTEGPLKQF